MTLLTHTHGPSYDRGAQSEARRATNAARAPAKGSHAALIKQACGFALTVTLMTLALAGIIALKTSIYLARFHF
jgi:hypothetical protein